MPRGWERSTTDAPSSLGALLERAAEGAGSCLVVARGSDAPMFCDVAVADAERHRIGVRHAVGSPHPFGAFEVVCELLGVDVTTPEAEQIRRAGTGLAALEALAARVDLLCVDQPQLLVVDRADRADASSARFLRYLAGHLEARSASLLLVAVDVAPRSWLEDLASTFGGVQRLRPTVEPEGPPLTQQRLTELGPGGRNVVEALAVLGPGASVAGVVAVSEEAMDVVLATLDRLATWRALRRTPQGAGHLLGADAVLDAMAPTRRAELHERAAVHGRAIGESALRLATHLEHAVPGALEWSATMLRAGAALSLQSDDASTAVRWMRRAIEEEQVRGEETPLHELLELAHAQARASDPGATATLRLAAERSDERGRLRLQIRLGRQLSVTGRLREAVAVFDGVLAEVDRGDDDHRDLRLDARAGLVTACRCSLELRPRSAELLEQLAAELRTAGSDDPSVLAELAYEHALMGTEHGVVLELAGRSTTAMANRPLAAVATQALFLALVWAEDLEAASLLCDQLHDDAGHQPVEAHRRATIALAEGDLDLAVACARKAVADIEWVAPMLVPGARAQLARALLRQGDLGGADAALRLPGGEGRWRHQTSYHPVLLARAELAAARGEWRQAASFADTCAGFSRQMGTLNPAVVPWHVVSARALAELGRPQESDAVLAEAIERATAFGAPGALARLEAARDAIRGAAASPPTRWQAPPVPVPAATSGRPAGRELRLLGDTVLVVDGDERRLGDDLADRAMCIIGLARSGVHDEQLAEALWPDGDPAVGRNRLRNVLLRVRQRYGPIVERRGRTVALADDVAVDVHEFDRLVHEALAADDPTQAERAGRRALDLHGGELCPVHPFEAWADGPRVAVRQRWLALVDRMADLLARRGDIAGSLALTESAITTDPWAEDRYLDAAERLAAADRPAAARSLLRRCERMCVELGVPPSPRQVTLADAIR